MINDDAGASAPTAEGALVPTLRVAAIRLAIELADAGLELRDASYGTPPPSDATLLGDFQDDTPWGPRRAELWGDARRRYSDEEKERIVSETREKVLRARAEDAERGLDPWDRADVRADHDALARRLFRDMRGAGPRALLKRAVRLLLGEDELRVLLGEVRSRSRQAEDEAWLFDAGAWERLALH